MEQLLEWDKRLVLYLNGLHASWLDTIMYWITKTEFWIPLYLLLLFFIIKSYRNTSWIIIVGIVITILLADQVTSGLMKPYFERLRPSHDPVLADLIHTVNGYTGGLYGFASSHAANTFGIALYCWLILKDKYPRIWIIFIWAILVSYSRIYLGVHFPGDILVGALVGMTAAFLCVLLTRFLLRKYRIDDTIFS